MLFESSNLFTVKDETYAECCVILFGGMCEFWRTGRVTGLEFLLEPDSGDI